MHEYPYPSYLKTHRTRWTLTQHDLSALLGVSDDAISRYESLNRTPALQTVIAAEFIFGVHARRIFPSLYTSVERNVAARAAVMAESIGDRTDEESLIKRQLIEAIALRMAGEQFNV